MENYKIFVNRPELTSEQMVQSIEFSQVKNYYAIYKKAVIRSTFVKNVFIKVAIGLTILTSSIIMYKSNSSSALEIQQSIAVNDIVQKTRVKQEEIIITNDTNLLNPSKSFAKLPKKNNFDAAQINAVSNIDTANDSIVEIISPSISVEKIEGFFIKQNINPVIAESKNSFTSTRQKRVAQTAKIYFIRTTGYNGSATAFRAFVDDTLKCKLKNKSYSIHELAPGRHIISTQITGKKSKEKAERITIDMEAGKIYYVQMIYKIGLLVSNLYCQEVTENSAISIMVNLKENRNCH